MLAKEMAALIHFKTSTLTAFGLQRQGVWGEETTSQKIEHLGLMFGALAAHPMGPVRGYGVPCQHLTFGMLVFPSVCSVFLSPSPGEIPAGCDSIRPWEQGVGRFRV